MVGVEFDFLDKGKTIYVHVSISVLLVLLWKQWTIVVCCPGLDGIGFFTMETCQKGNTKT